MEKPVAASGAGDVLLGIDVGGTFTDAVLLAAGRTFRVKLLTTADQSEGVIAAALLAMRHAGIVPESVDWFAHGMTTATNALLERKGALTASVTTAGFRDILEIGRQNRPRLYDLCPQRPSPLITGEMRLVVQERVTPEGEVVPLAREEMERVAAKLKEMGPEAVAVCLLFSFLDPSHEQALGGLLGRELPGAHISLSSQILPQFREYERFSTTAVDAYLTPVVDRYLRKLARRGKKAGLPEPAIMQSSGGVLPLHMAAGRAAPLLLSGPAAGVVGAIFASAMSSVDNLIAFDMGGTSTDVTLARNGSAELTDEREIGGFPVALPMVDVHTIGAGGGSIARVDAGGALRVGPESAGADPGPACYGQGGTGATVTDANLCLGYLGESLGDASGIRLHRGKAIIVMEQLAAELGISLEEAAVGIRQIVGAGMVKALRVISVERGYDPRQFVLVAFGGAGPMHGADLATDLGINKVLVPVGCGVLSALGMVAGDRRRDWVRTVLSPGGWDEKTLQAAFDQMERYAAAEMKCPHFVRQADLRYKGQSHELTVNVELPYNRARLSDAFEQAHENAYGFSSRGEDVELVNVRLAAVIRSQRFRKELIAAGAGPAGKQATAAGRRSAFFGGQWLVAQIWRRENLGGEEVAGPAVIEEDEATTVVPPGWIAQLDDSGNMWLSSI